MGEGGLKPSQTTRCVCFTEDKRAVRDCYNNLARELTKKIKNEERASSIETEMTNLEKDLIEREDAAESE